MHIVIDKKGGTMFQLLTRMSVGTSDITAISSVRTQAHLPQPYKCICCNKDR